MFLALIGPPFGGTPQDYERLAAHTGLVAYELRTRVRPDGWSLVRHFADERSAAALAEQCAKAGFRATVVPGEVASDAARPFAPVSALEPSADAITFVLPGRRIPVPWRAVLLIVRGEAAPISSPSGPRSVQQPRRLSTGTLQALGTDAFAAADIHFITVPWVARLDARSIQFPALPDEPQLPAPRLDRVCDVIAEAAGARVDRAQRSSSVSGFVRQLTQEVAPFDAYSRLIAQAERQARG